MTRLSLPIGDSGQVNHWAREEVGKLTKPKSICEANEACARSMSMPRSMSVNDRR
jgi:hypothetical protein